MEKDGDNQRSPDSRKSQGDEDISKIEDFSERITIDKKMNIGIFWDVTDYPFPDDTCPDEIYEKIKLAVDSEGLLSIWAYFDETKPTSVKFFVDKTWKSRLYFIAAGNKRDRLTRMFNDIMFWKLDVLTAPAAAKRLFIISDGVESSDTFFYEKIHRLGSIGITTNLYTLASKDHQPGNLQWTKLRGENWVELVPNEFAF